MTLNPFALLEKLINERGSAAVLLKQLELARDEFAALERKLSETATLLSEASEKNRQLESGKDDLQATLRDQKNETDLLKKQIRETYEKDHGRAQHQIAILKILDPHEGKRLCDIAKQFDLSEKAAIYHLRSLSNDGFVSSPNYLDNPELGTPFYSPSNSTWIIQQLGLAYLAMNGELT